MRVLIIGASGLLGRAVVKAFGAAGHEVFAVGIGALASPSSHSLHCRLVTNHHSINISGHVAPARQHCTVMHAGKAGPA